MALGCFSSAIVGEELRIWTCWCANAENNKEVAKVDETGEARLNADPDNKGKFKII